MTDLYLGFGGDLAAGPTGDVACADGAELGRQRVLRRLLTNPGDYIWNPSYGAGLGAFVGRAVQPARIRAVVRGQIFKERAVARDPEPVIAVEAAGGGAVVRIRYADAATGTPQILDFSVGGA